MLSPKILKEMESHHQLIKEQQPYEQLNIENSKLKEQQFYKHDNIVLSPSKQFLDFKLQTDSLLPSIQEETEPDTPVVTLINNNYHKKKSKKEKTRPVSFHVPTSKDNLESIITTPMIPTTNVNAITNVNSDLSLTSSSSSSSLQKRHTMCLSKKNINPYVPSLDIPSKPTFTR